MGFFDDFIENIKPETGLKNMPDTSYLTDGNTSWPAMQIVPGLYLDNREEEIKSSLERSAGIWGVSPSAFALGQDKEQDRISQTYRFVEDLPSNVGAATVFQGSKRPYIKLNNSTPIHDGYFEHEGMHRLSPHFRGLLPDGGVRDWNINYNKGLSGYSLSDDSWKEYKPEYDRFDNYQDRSAFFADRFANDPMNQQRPELKKHMGAAVGSILADDLLNKDSNAPFITSRPSYANDPEELLARAIATYGYMKELPPEERYNNTGKHEYFYSPATKEQAEKYGTFEGANIGMPYVNKSIKGGARIRPETYEAIKLWMDNNRMNKYGNGFAMGSPRGPLSA